MESKQSRTPEIAQRDRFIDKARELECDEDESRFNETLKRLAPKAKEQDS